MSAACAFVGWGFNPNWTQVPSESIAPDLVGELLSFPELLSLSDSLIAKSIRQRHSCHVGTSYATVRRARAAAKARAEELEGRNG